MSALKARIARIAAVLFAAAVAVFGSVIPASADITSVAVTDPVQNEILNGSFDSDGTPTGFKVTLKGSANTTCTSGWQSVKFTVSGPSGSQVFNVSPPSSGSWSGSAPTQWDTTSLKNGIYTIKLDVVEKDTIALQCNGEPASAYVTAKLANPARAPIWASTPAAASDGSASVTLRWHKSDAVDALEYRIVRSGPDGTKVAPVSAASPGGQGCSVSSNVYTCIDTSFSSAYSGTYTYGIVALRERPAYNSSEPESDKIECLTVSKPCVVSPASETHNVSLVAPTPTPTPTDQPSTPAPGNNNNNTPGTPSSNPNPGGSSNTRGGTRVLSGGGGTNNFYTGTYSETLPYTPRTLILGGGSATSSPQASGYEGDVVSQTAPDYRTIMLPVAGGLLAFLSAAHVRRLLLHL
ncbi:MAG: hypothetical protein ACRDKG_16840 [Actinomycetota bacterium]